MTKSTFLKTALVLTALFTIQTTIAEEIKPDSPKFQFLKDLTPFKERGFKFSNPPEVHWMRSYLKENFEKGSVGVFVVCIDNKKMVGGYNNSKFKNLKSLSLSIPIM